MEFLVSTKTSSHRILSNLKWKWKIMFKNQFQSKKTFEVKILSSLKMISPTRREMIEM
jgi:hypothetical protein